MRRKTVGSKRLLYVRHTVPRGRVVEFKVIGNAPVSTYVVNEEDLRRLQLGQSYSAYGGFQNRTFHHQVLELFDLRRDDSWYLAIYNPNDTDTDVYLEVLY